MHFPVRVAVQASVEDVGWDVRFFGPTPATPICDPATGEPLVRKLSRTAHFGFPLPPRADADNIPDAAPHAELCRDTDGQLIYSAYRSIVARQPGPRGIDRFGAYLFQTLLGGRIWNLIDAAAGESSLELGLTWPSSERVFNRLPWEMMRADNEKFLAEEPEVAITRRVAGTSHLQLGEITSPPRVLFVVGSRFDLVIRPGAEYLGLLRALRDAHELVLGLRTHLLVEATRARLEHALSWFRPTVVHFICHGSFEDGSGVLYLTSDETPGNEDAVTPGELAALLATDQPPPQIVVLNACHTGEAEDPGLIDAGRSAAPFASELVTRGFPVVVGMAGEVADRACRLFSRRFYQALLEGGEMAHAAAEGRRAGVLRHGGDPHSSVDWALPTLYIAEGVTEPRLEVTPLSVLRDWHVAAADYAPPEFPAFCDRTDVVPLYNLLLADADIQRRALQRKADLQVLAVFVNHRDLDSEERLGRTWLLREMAAQAARNGHLPCLLDEYQPSDDYVLDLLAALERAGDETAMRFKLHWNWKYFTGLQQLSDGDPLPADFPAEIRARYHRKPLDPPVLAVALRLDLLRLLEAARAVRAEESERTRLLLLIDNVHRMDRAADLLLNHLLGPLGLRGASPDVRVVFTYSSMPAHGQEVAINRFIKPWLERANWAESIPLKAFQPPLEDRLAYEFYLLNWRTTEGERKPLVISESPENEPWVKWFLDAMTENVRGIPSKLETASFVVSWALKAPTFPPVLIEADDEAALKFLDPVKRQIGAI
jgi:hypothetical protein